MPRLRTLETAFPIACQLALAATPVLLANVITPDRADEQDWLKAWANDAAFMKRQPGFIPAQLHCAVGDRPNRSELRDVGGDRCCPGGIHQSGVESNPLFISLARNSLPHLFRTSLCRTSVAPNPHG